MTNWAVATIATRNYLHYIRVLSASVLQIHPEAIIIVCLVDEPPQGWRPELERFQVIMGRDLGIPNWNQFLFQYSPFELTCALKPFVLNHILKTKKVAKLFYFDGDILVCGRLDDLLNKLESTNVILTPHLTEPMSVIEPDPWEVDIISTGIFNGGFVGLRNSETARAMLDWWQTRNRSWCKHEINMHDQGWLEAVPVLFDGVLIEREGRYNAAVWNTGTRSFAEDEQGGVTVNGKSLAFFHFASLDPDKPGSLSRIARRDYEQEPAAVRRLHRGYLAQLQAAGMAQCRAWGYQFNRLTDGTPIKEEWRELVRLHHPALQAVENPFSWGRWKFERLVCEVGFTKLVGRARRYWCAIFYKS